MADAGIFATTLEVQRKVGANANSTANVEAYINDFMTQAESIINSAIRFNFSDTYSTLNVDVKEILKSAASAWAAMRVINYDLNSWSLSTAQTKLDVLRDEFLQALSILRDMKHQTFIKNA